MITRWEIRRWEFSGARKTKNATGKSDAARSRVDFSSNSYGEEGF
jgi:hypothetical protein